MYLPWLKFNTKTSLCCSLRPWTLGWTHKVNVWSIRYLRILFDRKTVRRPQWCPEWMALLSCECHIVFAGLISIRIVLCRFLSFSTNRVRDDAVLVEFDAQSLSEISSSNRVSTRSDCWCQSPSIHSLHSLHCQWFAFLATQSMPAQRRMDGWMARLVCVHIISQYLMMRPFCKTPLIAPWNDNNFWNTLSLNALPPLPLFPLFCGSEKSGKWQIAKTIRCRGISGWGVCGSTVCRTSTFCFSFCVWWWPLLRRADRSRAYKSATKAVEASEHADSASIHLLCCSLFWSLPRSQCLFALNQIEDIKHDEVPMNKRDIAFCDDMFANQTCYYLMVSWGGTPFVFALNMRSKCNLFFRIHSILCPFHSHSNFCCVC